MEHVIDRGVGAVYKQKKNVAVSFVCVRNVRSRDFDKSRNDKQVRQGFRFPFVLYWEDGGESPLTVLLSPSPFRYRALFYNKNTFFYISNKAARSDESVRIIVDYGRIIDYTRPSCFSANLRRKSDGELDNDAESIS